MKPHKPLLLFFRKFFPLSRRALILLFRGKIKPSFELFHAKKTSGKLIDTIVNLKVKNGLILQVNGHSLPIYSDGIITLKVPNSSSELEIRLRGLFGSIRREVDVQKSVVQLRSTNIHLKDLESIKRALGRNPKISERAVKVAPKNVRLKSSYLTLNSKFSFQRINTSLKIKKTQPSLTSQISIMDVTYELETTLITNQIDYEK